MPTAEPTAIRRWTGPTVIALLLLAAFFLFTTPIEDSDCFWHVATGQWIWEHKSLPTTDPFTHTFRSPEAGTAIAERLHFYLSQYWLGQLVLAAAWGMGGATGIILLRALVFTAMLAVLYRWLKRSTDLPTTLLFLLLTALHLHQYPGSSPVIFSLLLILPLMSILEQIRISGRPEKRQWLLLPLVMLTWSNIDDSYIMGVAVILIYLLFYLLSLPSGDFWRRWQSSAIMALAIAASWLNPSGAAAFREFFDSLSQPVAPVVLKHLPPLQATIEHGVSYPAYWTGLAIIALVGIFRYRKMELPHLFTIFLLTALSLLEVRFTPLLLFAAPLTVPYIPPAPKLLLRGLAAATVILLTVTVNWKQLCHFGTYRLNPAGAAEFLRKARPAQNIFNYYDWGGYLFLSAPGYKTFIDGRNVDAALLKRYNEALFSSRWREVFDEFGVNTVIMPAASEWTPSVYPLVTNLVNSEWLLVYNDETALVFARDVPQNREIISRYNLILHKARVYAHTISLLDLFPPSSRKKADYWNTRGNAQMKLGDYPAATSSFRQALTIDPANEWAQMMLRSAPR